MLRCLRWNLWNWGPTPRPPLSQLLHHRRRGIRPKPGAETCAAYVWGVITAPLLHLEPTLFLLLISLSFIFPLQGPRRCPFLPLRLTPLSRSFQERLQRLPDPGHVHAWLQ